MKACMRSWQYALPAFILLLMLFLSCSPDSETTLKRVKREGVIRVGFANDIPFGHATPDGKLTGEAPEVARKVLDRMGIRKIEGVLTEFGSLIPALKAGRFDMIAAGMFITPERCQEIAFSEPTYSIGQAFLVKAGNPKYLHSYEDVATHPDAILCVMEGAVEGDYAQALNIPDSRIIRVPDTPTGLTVVKDGRADALALTSLSIQNLIKSSDDPKIERALPFTDPVINGNPVRGYGAFGFRKQDRDLLEEFNRHLKTFIGSKEHLETVKPFGFTEFPEDITTEELCEGQK